MCITFCYYHRNPALSSYSLTFIHSHSLSHFDPLTHYHFDLTLTSNITLTFAPVLTSVLHRYHSHYPFHSLSLCLTLNNSLSVTLADSFTLTHAHIHSRSYYFHSISLLGLAVRLQSTVYRWMSPHFCYMNHNLTKRGFTEALCVPGFECVKLTLCLLLQFLIMYCISEDCCTCHLHTRHGFTGGVSCEPMDISHNLSCCMKGNHICRC